MQRRATPQLEPAAERRLAELLSRTRFVPGAYLFGSGVRQRLRFKSDLDIGVASSLGPLSPAALRSVAQSVSEATGRSADVADLASASRHPCCVPRDAA
jgi:predicted nucleotidyltransferase